ncbi:UDP-N-acetylglucosamine diphosphorylase [Sporobolomyces salmoneus]|uniref:UDP-N-acetylglucosamine diphosphorylase n=1 Tax=Sporobolomyces salmoneus TaxID=183962 RepID=UPI003171D0ED
MSGPSSSELDALRKTWQAAGQDHVFTFYDQLSALEQRSLFDQLVSINPSRVNSIHSAALQAEKDATASTSDDISPPPADCVGTVINQPQQAQEWNEIGLKSIREGKAGVLLMAGGQGTRLGSSAPKGCYDIGLPSHKSLFQLQAERIKRLEVVAGAKQSIPWYIMTSGPTRKPTEDFFRQNKYFGLEEEQIIFFEQGVLPCLTDDGKIFLDTPSSVAVAPDGNGGLYAALKTPLSSSSDRTVLSDLSSRNISYLHAYCVDNCLVRVADPVFLGYCISRGSDCGAKVVKKTIPTESVGVVAQRQGKFSVVEYSEISKEMAERTESGGDDLAFRAANIANHFYTREFLEEVANYDESKMPFHIARKKIPHVDLKSKETVKPSKPNGMKLEQFVFDVFPFVKSFALLEAERKEEFSPLKNAPGTGSDDPETSRRDLLEEQKKWLENAGAQIESGVEVELSPLVSYAGEGLEGVKGLKLVKSGVAESIEELKKLAA